ncbi:acyl carrier protein [Catellatospora sp. NPDC049609]|jgi:acyl carrier protein|uniref:acyl carrier protein n=1 Tax=Catellatospora sp. NPDC049609 TaxID=3155505 RepID=UPI00342E5AFF
MTTTGDIANLTQDEITDWCRQAVATLLEIPVADVDPAADFDRLGLDSALAVSLLIDIEEKFGVDLPPEALFENPTLNAVTAYLHTAIQRQRGV